MIGFENKNSLFLKIAISVGILFLLSFKVDLQEVSFYLSHTQNFVWISAIACMLLQITFLSYRWHLIINARETRTDFLNAAQVTIASTLANYLFITSLGGLVVRVALSVQNGFSVVRSIAGTAVDRFMTLFALVLLTAFFMPISITASDEKIIHNTFFVLCLFGLGGGVFILLLFNIYRQKIIFSHRKVAACFKYLRDLFTDKPLISKIIASSLLAQLSYFAAVYIITASHGLEFSWLNFLAIIPLVTVISSLPIGYGGWGIREGAFVYGLGLIAIPVELAFSISVQIGLISILSSAIAAIPAIAVPKTYKRARLR